jgi:hypothetical protein
MHGDFSKVDLLNLNTGRSISESLLFANAATPKTSQIPVVLAALPYG